MSSIPGSLFRYWGEVRGLLATIGVMKVATWGGLVLLVLNYGYHEFLIGLLDVEAEDYGESSRRIFAPDKGQGAAMVAKASRFLNRFMASWQSLTVDWRLFLKRLRQCR